MTKLTYEEILKDRDQLIEWHAILLREYMELEEKYEKLKREHD